MSISLSDMRDLVDAYKETRDRRLAEQKLVDKIKESEDSLKVKILELLREQEAPVIGGTTHQCTRKVSNEPFAEDWELIHAHIIDTGDWDLMQKRLGEAAVKLRWDEGEEVPGVGSFPVEKLGLTKLPEGA